MSPKGCSLGRLSDDASVGDFRHWCESVENNVESHRTWKGAASVLRAIRRPPTVVTKDEFDAICNKINDDHNRDDGFRRLSNSDWIYAKKLTRLHRYLVLRNAGLTIRTASRRGGICIRPSTSHIQKRDAG